MTDRVLLYFFSRKKKALFEEAKLVNCCYDCPARKFHRYSKVFRCEINNLRISPIKLDYKPIDCPTKQ